MNRTEEDLPEGQDAHYDVDRGQEVVFVTEKLGLGTWRAPYCGPRTFRAPRFRCTEEELRRLEAELAPRVPLGSTVRLVRCSPAEEDGTREWAAFVAVTGSGPTVAGD
jgi:hypothetical protein